MRATSASAQLFLCTCCVSISLTLIRRSTGADLSALAPDNTKSASDASECEVYADYGKNYLTPVDVVVRNSENNIACIKARFALSIKVEELFRLTPRTAPGESVAANNRTDPLAPSTDTIRSILGYLPLEHVLAVEDSCPSPVTPRPAVDAAPATVSPAASAEPALVPSVAPAGLDKGTTTATAEENGGSEVEEELEMIVTFGCGKLSFTFKRNNERIFVSSIKGVVKLEKRVVREFISVRPMFVTSDLEHHFKYDDIIEVTSEAEAKTYILTANFYFTEIEAFRNTTSRDFVQPPDESSQPFEELAAVKAGPVVTGPAAPSPTPPPTGAQVNATDGT